MITLQQTQAADCDVLVVGAGPGGAATATYLARAGWRVTLIDAATFPRDKVCGDFVGPVALDELNRLGLTGTAGFPRTNVVTRAAFHLNGKELLRRDLPGGAEGLPPYGRVIPRLLLDDWILRGAVNAGAGLVENCRFLSYATDDDGVTVMTRYRGEERRFRTRLLVAADGSHSSVGRQLTGNKYPADSKIVAVRAYCEGVTGAAEQADLYFNGDSFPGYYWYFPTGPDTANLGVGMVLETLPPSEDHLKALLKDVMANDPVLRARLKDARIVGKVLGWPLSTYDPGYPIFADRMLLVGDAAGLINSLNGEGIQYALLSGRWAAEAAAECLRADTLDAAALGRYRRRVMDEIGYDLALSRLIIQFIRNRQLNPLWLKLLEIIVTRARQDDGYADTAGGVLAGTVPAKEVLSPDFLIKTIFQGGVTLGLDGVAEVLRGPVRWGHLLRDSARFSARLGRHVAEDPRGYARWVTGVARDGLGLAGSAVADLLPTRPPDRTERVSPPPAVNLIDTLPTS
ncbi:NAD(P)/FAD-dependent oxidoreductase [Lewinella sp. IMCC34183]|uniref:NAD(P)/FAD-dependent oxidoreductase n=1 Tax=Lewinella sp. IMCC34183 TaxID=2248762 RepID=UPI000E286B04|nr:geranylgeranyl reductase family protein [Lewinella sp. IMCC34183]